jgi:hypothetical protein
MPAGAPLRSLTGFRGPAIFLDYEWGFAGFIEAIDLTCNFSSTSKP